MQKRRTFGKRGGGPTYTRQPFDAGATQNYYIDLNTYTGRAYGSWITAGRASAVSDANVVSGGKIINPVGVIESIVQDELITGGGGTSIDVNTDSFDAAYDMRSGWQFDVSVFEQVRAFDLLNDLAFQSGCKVFFNFNKELTIKAFDNSNSIDAYFVSEPTGLQESLNYGHITGLLELQPTYLDDMYNAVQVNYQYDYAKGIYLSNVYVNSSTSNWATVTDTTAIAYCAAAETNYGVTNKKYTFDARAIQDTTTAERLCNHIADRLTRRLYYARFQTGLDGIQIELGDFVNIQHHLVNTMWPSSYATKKWEVVGIKFLGAEMSYEITAIEV